VPGAHVTTIVSHQPFARVHFSISPFSQLLFSLLCSFSLSPRTQRVETMLKWVSELSGYWRCGQLQRTMQKYFTWERANRVIERQRERELHIDGSVSIPLAGREVCAGVRTQCRLFYCDQIERCTQPNACCVHHFDLFVSECGGFEQRANKQNTAHIMLALFLRLQQNTMRCNGFHGCILLFLQNAPYCVNLF
jgi:hypothetical protein